MKLHAESHLDHSLTQQQIDYLVDRFRDRDAFFIETVELPEHLGTVPCGLHGPIMGDEPVRDAYLVKRGERANLSRVCDRPARPSRLVTIIAGPHADEPCIVYTAFGGPLAPQEVGDPGCKDVYVSAEFWFGKGHALSR